jgi:4'-phosphopantetheinyl transferase
VWRARLDIQPARTDELAATLSRCELDRAARLRSDTVRRRFVSGRGALREILAGYLDVAPTDVRFREGSHGKPAIAGPDAPLEFNVSRSGILQLIAVRADGPVGVDIEMIRPDFEWEPVAAAFFAPAEMRALISLTANARTDAFFRCWTRKEAYVKARGEGLSLPLDGFEVSLRDDAPPRLIAEAGVPRRRGPWRICDCKAGPGYVAAAAGAGPIDRLTPLWWSP